MEIIDELEIEKRGVGYAGGVGYFGCDGSVDTCIVLRTALFKDGMMYVQGGGGVVADSDPNAEYDETLHKARALRRAAEESWRFCLTLGRRLLGREPPLAVCSVCSGRGHDHGCGEGQRGHGEEAPRRPAIGHIRSGRFGRSSRLTRARAICSGSRAESVADIAQGSPRACRAQSAAPHGGHGAAQYGRLAIPTCRLDAFVTAEQPRRDPGPRKAAARSGPIRPRPMELGGEPRRAGNPVGSPASRSARSMQQSSPAMPRRRAWRGCKGVPGIW